MFEILVPSKSTGKPAYSRGGIFLLERLLYKPNLKLTSSRLSDYSLVKEQFTSFVAGNFRRRSSGFPHQGEANPIVDSTSVNWVLREFLAPSHAIPIDR
jgi:hypothetical protein